MGYASRVELTLIWCWLKLLDPFLKQRCIQVELQPTHTFYGLNQLWLDSTHCHPYQILKVWEECSSHFSSEIYLKANTHLKKKKTFFHTNWKYFLTEKSSIWISNISPLIFSAQAYWDKALLIMILTPYEQLLLSNCHAMIHTVHLMGPTTAQATYQSRQID